MPHDDVKCVVCYMTHKKEKTSFFKSIEKNVNVKVLLPLFRTSLRAVPFRALPRTFTDKMYSSDDIKQID